VPPRKPKKITRKNEARFIRETRTYGVNLAKWKAAETLCEKKGWTFIKLTEKELVFVT
jgi:hypothetical protein